MGSCGLSSYLSQKSVAKIKLAYDFEVNIRKVKSLGGRDMAFAKFCYLGEINRDFSKRIYYPNVRGHCYLASVLLVLMNCHLFLHLLLQGNCEIDSYEKRCDNTGGYNRFEPRKYYWIWLILVCIENIRNWQKLASLLAVI